MSRNENGLSCWWNVFYKYGNGNFLNIDSTTGFQPSSLMMTYFVIKAYVNSSFEALAEEFENSDIIILD